MTKSTRAENEQRAHYMHKAKMSDESIARELGVSVRTVKDYLRSARKNYTKHVADYVRSTVPVASKDLDDAQLAEAVIGAAITERSVDMQLRMAARGEDENKQDTLDALRESAAWVRQSGDTSLHWHSVALLLTAHEDWDVREAAAVHPAVSELLRKKTLERIDAQLQTRVDDETLRRLGRLERLLKGESAEPDWESWNN